MQYFTLNINSFIACWQKQYFLNIVVLINVFNLEVYNALYLVLNR